MRLKILLLPLLFLTLKDGNSLTVALSIPPPPEESGVEWSAVRWWAAVAANCLVPPLFLGGGGALFVGTASLLISNSKCGHLEAAKSFIHWSDCETRRWSEALTVTS